MAAYMGPRLILWIDRSQRRPALVPLFSVFFFFLFIFVFSFAPQVYSPYIKRVPMRRERTISTGKKVRASKSELWASLPWCISPSLPSPCASAPDGASIEEEGLHLRHAVVLEDF